MFCPKCGNAAQTVNSYCRRCGTFLPDFDNFKSSETTPEQHFIATIVLNAMTGIVSLTLAILLYVFFLGKEDTSPLIYITAGFLTAIFFWQVQTFWRTLLLKRKFIRQKNKADAQAENLAEKPLFQPAEARDHLNAADFENVVPLSVTERTTNKMGEKIERKLS